MPSQSCESPQFPPGWGTHSTGSQSHCLSQPQAATAASPALFSKLFPWPRLTPALGLSCSLLSSFSLEKSRNNDDAEGAELIYAEGSPTLLYSSPKSTFENPHGHDPSLDGTGATITSPFPPPLGYNEPVKCDIAPLPAPALASHGYWGFAREIEDFFQGRKKNLSHLQPPCFLKGKSIFPFGRDT